MGKEIVLNFGLLEGTEMLKKCSKHFTELRSLLSPFVMCIIPQSAIPFSSLCALSPAKSFSTELRQDLDCPVYLCQKPNWYQRDRVCKGQRNSSGSASQDEN